MERSQIIKAVQDSVSEVFTTMLALEVSPTEVHSDKSSPAVNDGVMAFVGIAGPWMGTGIVTCDATFACRLCELFLMSEAPSVNEEVLDAVGEIANMVIGNFKTAAEAQVGSLALSVPTVVYGRNFTSKSVGSAEWFVLPFLCGEDRFEVRVCFAPAADNVNQARVAGHMQMV